MHMQTTILFRNSETLNISLPIIEVITQLMEALSKGKAPLGLTIIGSPTQVAGLVCMTDIVAIWPITPPVGNKDRKGTT